MKKYLPLFLLLLAPAARSQQTTVFATVVDPNGNPYANGTVSAVLTMPTGIAEARLTSDGSLVDQHPGPSSLDAVGHFSITLVDNHFITPAGTQWFFTVCGTPVNIGPRGNVAPVQKCFVSASPYDITGASVSLTSQLNAVAAILGPALGSGGGGGGTGVCSIGMAGPGGLFGITGSPIGSDCTGVLGFTTTGISGGLPYFLDANTLASSLALTDQALIRGGGPGNPPSSSPVIATDADPMRSPNGINVTSQGFYEEYANDSAGTTNFLLACKTATNTVKTCPASVTSGAAGIVFSGAGTAGTGVLCTFGNCPALFDNQSVVNDLAVPSTTPGRLHDSGGTVPTPNSYNFVIATANSGAGTTALVHPPGDLAGGSSSSGLTSCLTTLGDIWTATAGGNCDRLAAPTSPDGLFQFLGGASAGGLPTKDVHRPAGISGRNATAATDTVLYTDRAQGVVVNRATAVASSLPAPSGNFANNFVFFEDNIGVGVDTITPVSGTCNGNATCALSQGDMSTIYSPDNTNYNARIFSSPVLAGAGITSTRAAHSNTIAANASTRARGLSFTIGTPGGTALTAGASDVDYLTVPVACTISAYNLNIDAGTITVKFWKIATGTAIPTVANVINTSGVGIASGTAIHSTTVSDFTTTAVSANDILALKVTSVATAAYVNGVLQCDTP